MRSQVPRFLNFLNNNNEQLVHNALTGAVFTQNTRFTDRQQTEPASS